MPRMISAGPAETWSPFEQVAGRFHITHPRGASVSVAPRADNLWPFGGARQALQASNAVAAAQRLA